MQVTLIQNRLALFSSSERLSRSGLIKNRTEDIKPEQTLGAFQLRWPSLFISFLRMVLLLVTLVLPVSHVGAQTWLPAPPPISCAGLTPAQLFATNPVEIGKQLVIRTNGGPNGILVGYYFERIGTELRLHRRSVGGANTCYEYRFDTAGMGEGKNLLLWYDHPSNGSGGFVDFAAITAAGFFDVVASFVPIPVLSDLILVLLGAIVTYIAIRHMRTRLLVLICCMIPPPMAFSYLTLKRRRKLMLSAQIEH